jgi:hypothetical protein
MSERSQSPVDWLTGWQRSPGSNENAFGGQMKDQRRTAAAGGHLSHSDDDSAREGSSGGMPRYSRRLSDKILIAFHHACDQADFEVAEQLLHVLEMMLTRRPLTPDGTRRRNMESLVAAHERLWHLRHPLAETTDF